MIKHKTRLIANRFLQREDIDFGEVFAHVTRIETISLVVGIANDKIGPSIKWMLNLRF